MPLETGEFITDLILTNPLGSDAKSQGDDHLRLLKKTVQQSFPNVDGAVNLTPTEFNGVIGRLDTLEAGQSQAILSEQYPSGTSGAAYADNVWGSRILNTVDSDINNIAPLAASQFTLSAGTYYIKVTAALFSTLQSQLRIYDVTNSAAIIGGQSIYLGPQDTGGGPATAEGIIVISGDTAFEVQNWLSGISVFGQGISASTGAPEKYLTVHIMQLA